MQEESSPYSHSKKKKNPLKSSHGAQGGNSYFLFKTPLELKEKRYLREYDGRMKFIEEVYARKKNGLENPHLSEISRDFLGH